MKTVVICDSRGFKKEIREFASRLKNAEIVVCEPILNDDPDINECLSAFQEIFLSPPNKKS